MNKSKLSFSLPERLENEADISDEQLATIKSLAEAVEAEGLDFEIIATFGERQGAALIDRLTEIRDGKDSEEIIIEKEEKPSSARVVGWIIGLVLVVAFLWVLTR